MTIRRDPNGPYAEIDHPHVWYSDYEGLAGISAIFTSAQQYADRTRITQVIHSHRPDQECEPTCTEITPR